MDYLRFSLDATWTTFVHLECLWLAAGATRSTHSTCASCATFATWTTCASLWTLLGLHLECLWLAAGATRSTHSTCASCATLATFRLLECLALEILHFCWLSGRRLLACGKVERNKLAKSRMIHIFLMQWKTVKRDFSKSRQANGCRPVAFFPH